MAESKYTSVLEISLRFGKKRVQKMLKEEKMTPAGLKSIEGVDFTTPLLKTDEEDQLAVPDDFEKALKQNPTAYEHFYALAQSYRKIYIFWITSAKKEETRTRRIKKAVDAAEKKKKDPTM